MFLPDRDRVHDRCQLRHTHTGDDARGADGARANTDLETIRSGIDESLSAVRCRDIAGNHLH